MLSWRKFNIFQNFNINYKTKEGGFKGKDDEEIDQQTFKYMGLENKVELDPRHTVIVGDPLRLELP